MKTDLQFIVLFGGRSTRNFPHSKGLPHKALLPFGDFKIINHVIKSIYNAGGRNATFVIAESENTVFFQNCYQKEPKVEAKFENKPHLLSLLKQCYIPDDLDIDFVVQEKPLGIAHALALAAKPGKDVFMIWPDDVILSEHDKIYNRVVEEYHKTHQGNVITTRYVEDPSRWGIIENGLYIEKPKQSTSHEAVISPLILDKAVVDRCKDAARRLENGEIPDGMVKGELHPSKYLNIEAENDSTQRIRTVPLLETDLYLDCGCIEGYEKALLYTLVETSVFKDENKAYLKKVLMDA